MRGMRVIRDLEATEYRDLLSRLRSLARADGFEEVIVPSVWEQATFTAKAGDEILGQMYTFRDKGERHVCLIPEVTAVIEELWLNAWDRRTPARIFYEARCYRYEKPQAGRYREFTQFGVEYLGGTTSREECIHFLESLIQASGLQPYTLDSVVKRGLHYYIEDGFEVRCPLLGAQQQVAGGGRYQSGIGFAIGIDRILLARRLQATQPEQVAQKIGAGQTATTLVEDRP